MKISASFLSISNDLKKNIEILTNCDIDYLHLDIMDGEFVPNRTWNREEIENIINHQKPLDIHLMVSDVYSYVDKFVTLNPEYITFHYETGHILSKIKYIHDKGCKVGISIKPETKVEELLPYLPFVDLVLVMSVSPGQGGQSFLEESVSKIEWLHAIQVKESYSFLIEVDGGINDKTISKVKEADICVIGSFITNGNYEENIQKIRRILYG